MKAPEQLVWAEKSDEIAVIRSAPNNKRIYCDVVEEFSSLTNLCNVINKRLEPYKDHFDHLSITAIDLESDLVEISNGFQSMYYGLQDEACFDAKGKVQPQGLQSGLKHLVQQYRQKTQRATRLAAQGRM